ncbi:hypothetical protein ACFQVC_17225 [Streptomyces monticola]|uniref:Zinc-finger domain-containing protein n=1 Tax=Streptomyces monticola TaxID=2666263 RepID=A0ABW2JJY4_9ACTN
MTSTTGAAEHPEVSEISDLTEGLLSPARTTDVRRHLDGCELCSEVHDSLTEIRDLLGTLPGPPRMPADVAGRIDAALAAEALLDATAPEARGSVNPAASVSTPTSVSTPEPLSAPGRDGVETPREAETPRETQLPVSRETQPTSTSSGAVDRPSGHPRAATGPGRRSSATRRRRRGIATAALGAFATVAAIGLGVLLLRPDGGSQGDTPQASDKADPRVFSESALDDQVASLLTKKNDAAPDGESSKPSLSAETSPPTPKHTRLRDPGDAGPKVPQCVKLGIGRDTLPIAAKEGIYKGVAAYLVVLPDARDASRVTAYVVDSTCDGKASASKGEVLLTRSYPRG